MVRWDVRYLRGKHHVLFMEVLRLGDCIFIVVSSLLFEQNW